MKPKSKNEMVQWLEDENFTQEEGAARLGLSVRQLQKITSGRASLRLIHKLAMAAISAGMG